jgi:hypothetical protein
MTEQKTIVSGENQPLTIKLPDKYFDILFTMSEMEGTPIEELAAQFIKQMIIEDIAAEEFDGGYWGIPYRPRLERDA